MVPYRTLSSYKAVFTNSRDNKAIARLYGAPNIQMATEMADVGRGELAEKYRDNGVKYTIFKLPEEIRKRETAWHIIIK